MKPRRHLRTQLLPVGPIRCGAPLVLGFAILISGLTPSEAAIYGGTAGTPSNPQPGSTPVGGATPTASDAARANALEVMARTQQAVGAALALQNAARQAAANPSPTTGDPSLPAVPNGLVPGGLHVAPGATPGGSLWQGAQLPVEAIANGLTTVTVRQTAQQALLTWQTLNVGRETTLHFDQTQTGAAASQSIAFNKIVDPSANPTQILGQIKAEGQVYIINPNGIIFGGSSSIDVGAITASSLPINDNLVARGLLNNPSQEFLFDGLGHAGKLGDVTVLAGAKISTTVSADGNGGRIALVGPNVTNNGSLTSTNGQVILAAGLQVGVAAHPATDPSLRGLDVYIGAVTDPASALAPYAGSAANNGIISIARASAILTGKSVSQNGIIDSSTSVSLNGRVDLIAGYDAVANPAYATSGNPFLLRTTGSVTLGENSVTRILPELSSTDTTIGTELALRSILNLQGRTIHLAPGSIVHAPNAIANIHAGNWNYIPSSSLPTSTFVSTGGQVYLDTGSLINLAGTTGASASVTQNLLTLELRGSELAVAPVQREGELRGDTITVDLGKTGTYEGRFWVGTPLADLTGYVGLVQRDVGQLTTAGGTLNLSAGGSIVIRDGSTIDVSGGWTDFTGGLVGTTQVISGGRLVDIADALPGEIYSGIFDPTLTVNHASWGVSERFSIGVVPSGPRYQQGYTQGAAGGSLTLTAPSMSVDGHLVGHTIAGDTQLRNSTSTSSLPPAATLDIRFQSQILAANAIFTHYPTPPDVIFDDDTTASTPAEFALDASGNPLPLSSDRVSTVHLSPEKLAASGFGDFSLSNPGGGITLPSGSDLDLGPGSSIALTSSNITVAGNITAAGGSLSFNVHNISPYLAARETASGTNTELPLTPGLGIFTLAPGATLSTAGLVIDGRLPGAASIPALTTGGSISIRSLTADLSAGSVIDASGGYILSPSGVGRYGDGGSISIRTGQDISQNPVLGGSLHLGSTLLGHSGAKGASLTLQARSVQIGGSAPTGDILHLDPGFFLQGGFGAFNISGLAATGDNPALLVAPDTLIEPVARKLQVIPSTTGAPTLDLSIIDEPVAAFRHPVSISLTAPGVNDLSGSEIAHRGDVVISAGSVIRTEAGANLTVTGNTVTVLGSLIAPGGNITVGGGSSTSNIFKDPSQALVTTHIGSSAVISAAGTVVYTPDPFGRRLGTVYDGGNITLTGNIAALEGAVIDASGTSAVLDLDPLAHPTVPLSRTGALGSLSTAIAHDVPVVPTVIDSNGGAITLRGGQLLASDATLLARAGGSTALGGTLTVSSGFYVEPGVIPPASTVNLVVSQSGQLVTGSGAIGSAIGNFGRFTADTFAAGGFDSLVLGGASGGVVSFDGPVAIDARGSIRLASGGFLYANATVDLNASHIHLGQDLQAPALPEDASRNPFSAPYTPTTGSGSIHASASLIELGNLSLRDIGNLSLTAADGDIRGSGSVHIAGTMNLTAGQIYPTTASTLSLTAYDPAGGQGAIRIAASGNRDLPYSAGGTLNLHASLIHQDGTLRAPFGVINLGWDGSGNAPIDLVTGAAKPVTTSLTLGSHGITSVSGVDPSTGKALVLPYGHSPDGEKWIDPRGVDITTSGPPQKAVNLSARDLVTEAGSLIDLRGGGDLYAHRFVSGLGGISDILASTTIFAVIPGYQDAYAPVSEFNPSTSENNLIEGRSGYSAAHLEIGDRIYLDGSSSLPAGYYTLLPARYALLPGAVLVSPSASTGISTVNLPDGSSIVSGYRFNSLNTEREIPTLPTRFEIAPASVFRERALYEDFLANTFLPLRAQALNVGIPLLPKDSAQLIFQAGRSMSLNGSVSSSSIANGAGAAIDISSQLDILISSGGLSTAPSTITLDADILSSFGAESLLIGGKRVRSANAATVQVTAANITVDNAGSPLAAKDLILAANNHLTLSENARLSSTGSSTAAAETLTLTGNGSLLRVAASGSAPVIRTGATTAANPVLTVGPGAVVSGGSIVLDSSARIDLSPSADLSAGAYTFGSGRISLVLDSPGDLAADPGLVLDNDALLDFRTASSLALVSYSTIDLYGSGQLGSPSLASLTLSAGEIRGFNQGSATARVTAGNLTLANLSAASPSTPGSASGSLSFDAGLITLGEGKLTLGNYSSIVLEAARGITGRDTGELAALGDLTLVTPRLTGEAGAIRTISATGSLSLVSSPAAGANLAASGLGSSLTLSAASVSAAAHILLPSGSLAIRAAGDLDISGALDVSGSRRAYDGVIRYTGGGDITLASINGDVAIASGATLDLSADPGGASAGTLSISTPQGSFTTAGSILAAGGAGGDNGSFILDTATLPLLSDLGRILALSSLTHSQSIRVRQGDVIIDGSSLARDFRLSADTGSITVTGLIDASGATGGNILLSAHRDLVVAGGARLTVAGQYFSSAGKGGQITLEAGSQQDGTVGSGALDIRAGSTLDLSVASKISGNAETSGSSAWNGQFSGKLHLRAPEATLLPNLNLQGTLIDPSSVIVEGYRLHDLTSTGGTITAALQNQIKTDAQNFLGQAGTASAAYTAITDRLLASNPTLDASTLVLAPGVEIINRTGDLTLGTSSSTTTSDWDLSTFRFGAKSAPGILTLRAAGDLVFYNTLSDGFSPTADSSNASWLWTARLALQNTLLPVNTQSWSYRLTAGADLSAADFRRTLDTSALPSGKGNFVLGKTGSNITAIGNNSVTSSIIGTHYQIIRTGTGDIDIHAGRNVQLLNQLVSIYTAGARVTNPDLGGLFTTPTVSAGSQGDAEDILGRVQQSLPALYTMAGGNVVIHAGRNIERLTRVGGVLVADSQFQMPSNWLYRRGHVDPATGLFSTGRFTSNPNTTTWWVDFSNFFQGVGALGGGDVTLTAGNNISNVDAVIPTNARFIGATPRTGSILELGGGNLTVTAGNNIDAGVYYVERGHGILDAGNSIHTNATRSVLTQNTIAAGQSSVYTQLPTTLFLGKGGFDVSAGGDLLLGPVANAFLLPQGINNSFWYKSWFSTYGSDSYVNVTSLGGDITLRQSSTQPGGVEGIAQPLLQTWYTNKLLLSAQSASISKPWLRLSESSVFPFTTALSLLPGTLRATAHSGDVNLAGDITLAPSPVGTVEILASRSINAFQPNGLVTLSGVPTITWGASTIILSDANPASVPSPLNPLGRPNHSTVSAGTAASTPQTPSVFETFDRLFAESGGTVGLVLETKQALHTPGLLHLGDTSPTRLFAGEGDISGLTLFSPKPARIFAGRDISDVAFYLQNLLAGDTSVIAAGRDILPYSTSSLLRIAANLPGHSPNLDSGPLAGDLQISGPGALQIFAGGNIDLGTGANHADGTGSGITSIGNTRNPYLAETGAHLLIAAGLPSISVLDLPAFIETWIDTPAGLTLLDEISPGLVFADLTPDEQTRVAFGILYLILRDTGRAYPDTGGYDTALAAIATLFGDDYAHTGSIFTRSRDIRTTRGGDISILTPGGGLTLANSTFGNTLSPPGVITESGGDISIFAHDDISIGIGRIFTLRGGNEIIWSSEGNIAAGSSSKTVASAPPTRVLIDPQSAAVQTDLAGLATGGGIGVLATVAGVEPGDVDLIAPNGFVDAGDAGIRSAGNLNIAANQVLNAGNISTGGTATGTPSLSASVSVGSLTTVNTTASTTPPPAPRGEPTPAASEDIAATDELSIISVEVIGYGGGDPSATGDEEDEDEKETEEPTETR